MKIMILCGGRGRRLGQSTDKLPKPLVPFHRQTVLDLKLQDYLQQGFDEFIFCVGYKGDLIRQAVARYASRATLHFSDAGEQAGILERIWHARDLWDDRVILTYGDTFTDIDLGGLVDQHQHNGCAATIVAAPIESPFGLIEFDRNDRVTYFREKPTLSYYIGQAVIEKQALSLIPPDVLHLPDGEGLVTFYKILIALERLGVYYHTGLDITFNTQEELTRAEEKLVRFYTTSEKAA